MYLFDSKVKPPKCPNCDQIWDNLSRRCSNCKYTIVLTCDNCSQTINPLWRKCNLCGEPRQTVPEIALGDQVNNRFSYNRARFIALILLTIPFIILEIIYFPLIFDAYNSMLENGAISSVATAQFYLHDNIRRIVAWSIFLVFTLILVYRTSTGDRNSHLLIIDEFIRISYSEITLLAIFFALVLNLRRLSFGISILALFSIILLVLLILGYIYRRYRYLKDYDPIILSNSKMEEYR